MCEYYIFILSSTSSNCHIKLIASYLILSLYIYTNLSVSMRVCMCVCISLLFSVVHMCLGLDQLGLDNLSGSLSLEKTDSASPRFPPSRLACQLVLFICRYCLGKRIVESS